MESAAADKASRAGQSSSRRVSFLNKCHVIPPQREYIDDAVDDYFRRQAAADVQQQKQTKKSGRLHLPFRSSKASRRWSSVSSNELTQQHEKQPRSRSATQTRPDSVPNHAASTSQSYSPSLPISRDGTGNRLRQKLISPPPPEPETPLSPPSATVELLLGSAGRAASDTPPLALLSSPTIDSPISSPISPSQPLSAPTQSFTPPTALARPVAVRKPLTFGFGDDVDDDADACTSTPKLSVPPIVYSVRIPKRSVRSSQPPEDSMPAVLKWREASEDDSASSSGGDEDEAVLDNDGDSDEAVSFEEEDLHGECTCVDCEDKMVAALAPSYSPHWTRGARRKYLADRKEMLHEESRKAVRPPIWLRSEESEAAATSKLRDVCADEEDARQGISRRESVAKSDGQLGSALGITSDALDAELRKEVDEEVQLREEEHRLKKTRCEMRMLSSDFGSGLRIGSGMISGGGGARAMMRQLEEAEQAERRAKVERSRSPRIEADGETAARPMGAVGKDVPSKPFTPPPRIPSPLVSGNTTTTTTSASNVPEKSVRPPSPLKRALSASMAARGTSGVEEAATRANANASAARPKNGKGSPPGRHPSPSLLIRRELTLGIPVQSNTATRSRSSWQQAPTSSTFASPDAAGQSTPPPRLKSSDGTSSKLRDIAESTSSNGQRRDSAKGSPAMNMMRSNSVGAASSGGGTASIGTSSPPAFRRANTTGPGVSSEKSAHRASLYVDSSSSGAARPPPPLHLASVIAATPAHFVEARLDKAKSRARNSFKDLITRMKN